MINVGVQALTSTGMNDFEKDDLLNQAISSFTEHFPDRLHICLEEMASLAYKYEIENFKKDEDLNLKISESYQKFLKNNNKQKKYFILILKY